jgi:hypothetical protein
VIYFIIGVQRKAIQAVHRGRDHVTGQTPIKDTPKSMLLGATKAHKDCCDSSGCTDTLVISGIMSEIVRSMSSSSILDIRSV